MAALAFEDALPHLENALALVGDGDGRFELTRMQASALRGAGRVDDALTVLDGALAATTDRDQQITLRLQRVNLLNDQYRAAEGLGDVVALVAAAAEAQDPALEIAVQLRASGFDSSLQNRLVFAWWAGEEEGFRGSTAYLDSLEATGGLGQVRLSFEHMVTLSFISQP